MVTQDGENISVELPESRWFIDSDWYEQNRRSFYDMSWRSLCAKCAEKLQKRKKKVTTGDILAAIKNCCSESPDYITARLPIMESAFRILLANGNEPLGVTELGRRLSECRGGDTYTASPQMLNRLLSNDRWYGFKKVTE